MALTLISLLALSAYAFGTARGLVQKSIFHQFTPVPKTNTRYACWYTANICKSHRGNETLTYIICLNETCHPVLMLGSHNRGACGRFGTWFHLLNLLFHLCDEKPRWWYFKSSHMVAVGVLSRCACMWVVVHACTGLYVVVYSCMERTEVQLRRVSLELIHIHIY